MAIAWYLRLFYLPILNAVIAYLLYMVIKPERMTEPAPSTPWPVAELIHLIGAATTAGPSRPWLIVGLIKLIGLCVLMWFVPFSINLAFWIGIGIIVFGHVVNGLAYSAMREHPEKKKAVADWGVYGVSRHPHVQHGMITRLGTIAMGWNMNSTIYIILWAYFILDIILTHFALLNEEKRTIEKFGQEYVDYVKRVPRYFPVK